MKKAPKVLTRMRLSCCWGDNLNVEELNEIVDYINDLERHCKKQQEIIDNAIEYIKEHTELVPFNEDGSGGGLLLCDYDVANVLEILLGENNE